MVLLVGSNVSGQDAITLDSTVGSPAIGQIKANTGVEFFMRYQVVSASMLAMDECFVIGSPDGALWQLPGIETVDPLFATYLEGGIILDTFPASGMAPDTLLWGGFSILGPGVPVGYNDFAIRLNTIVSQDDIGKTICVDSASRGTGCGWHWNSGVSLTPEWGGPYCFEIVTCCEGFRGNINSDPFDMIDISDLTYLVNYAFLGGDPPPCVFEGDVNGDGSLTPFILDLTYLVDYMFSGGPPPPACP